MSTERLRRMKRLVDLGEHQVRLRKQGLAASTRASDEANSATAMLEQSWNDRANNMTGAKTMSFASFADDRAMLDAIRGQAARAAAVAAVASNAMEKSRVALSDANVELKKLELWRGNVQSALREVENKLERAQNDETAARSQGKKS
ncbi:MAG: flagellar FliJ family protein [Polyangiaceae bacterium]